MTLFEYLAVAFSIVLGLAAARLLDALPHLLTSGRRYWIHATITSVCLWNLGNAWWQLWSLHEVPEWTAARFFLVLLVSGLHYTIAGLLASPAAAEVASWRAYYWQIRVRLFSLGLVWLTAVEIQNWIFLDVGFWHPAQLQLLLGGLLMALGALSASARAHALIAISMTANAVIMTAGLFWRAPSFG